MFFSYQKLPLIRKKRINWSINWSINQILPVTSTDWHLSISSTPANPSYIISWISLTRYLNTYTISLVNPSRLALPPPSIKGKINQSPTTSPTGESLLFPTLEHFLMPTCPDQLSTSFDPYRATHSLASQPICHIFLDVFLGMNVKLGPLTTNLPCSK